MLIQHGSGAGLSQIRQERLRQLRKEAAQRASLQAQGRGTLQDIAGPHAWVSKLTDLMRHIS